MKFTKILLLITMAFAAMMVGCTGDQGSTTGPNADEFVPKGSVQGRLLDAVTHQPIVGAVIDMGVAKATTTETGQFVMMDVPVNQDSDGMGTNNAYDTYYITIDMRNVTSPINMQEAKKAAAATLPASTVYPDFDYESVSLKFVSLNDSSPLDSSFAAGGLTVTNLTATNNTNHDTTVNQLTATADLRVGKLAAALSGTVVSCSTLQPVTGSDWTIQLIRKGGGTVDSYLGISGNVISEIKNSSGAFSFTGIESLQGFKLKAFNSSQSMIGEEEVDAPADGQTKLLVAQNSQTAYGDTTSYDNSTVCVSPADNQEIRIVTVSPENGANIGDVTTASAKFKFSEPIKQNAYTDPANVLAKGIKNEIEVYFEKQVWQDKATNDVAFTLAWNTTFDELTVTIPALAKASIYTVDITPCLSAGKDCQLKDAAGKAVKADNVAKGKVRFYTVGAGSTKAPTSVTALNDSTMDWNSSPILDWNVASGAKAYRIYRNCDEVWPDGSSVVGQVVRIDADAAAAGDQSTTGSSTLSPDAVMLVEGNGGSDIALTCTYRVYGVGPDNTESATAASVTVSDKVSPDATGEGAGAGCTVGGPSGIIAGNCSIDELDANDIWHIKFSEPLRESNAETTANYVFNSTMFTPAASAATVSLATYLVKDTNADGTMDSFEVELKSTNFDGTTLPMAFINAGADKDCDTTAAAGDVQTYPADTPVTGWICTDCGTNGCEGTTVTTLATDDGNPDIAGDDVAYVRAGDGYTWLTPGPNGICNNIVLGGGGSNDVQVMANGTAITAAQQSVLDTFRCVSAGSNLKIDTAAAAAGDTVDTRSEFRLLQITGVVDVKGNAINTKEDEIILIPGGANGAGFGIDVR